jgi:hypothetical protein
MAIKIIVRISIITGSCLAALKMSSVYRRTQKSIRRTAEMDLLTSILVRRSSLGTSINLTRFRGIKMDEVFTPYAL